MKVLLCMLLFLNFLVACGGSCIECHVKLESVINDTDHSVLRSCISCHDKPSQNGQCGKDCFDCHSKEKLFSDSTTKEHQAIKQCYTCHIDYTNLVDLKKNDVSVPNRPKPLVELFK